MFETMDDIQTLESIEQYERERREIEKKEVELEQEPTYFQKCVEVMKECK